MPRITIYLNGNETDVEEGISVAAALINSGIWRFRTSVDGTARGPVCAMGVCFECRVSIDGEAHRRACMESCRDRMEVSTGG